MKVLINMVKLINRHRRVIFQQAAKLACLKPGKACIGCMRMLADRDHQKDQKPYAYSSESIIDCNLVAYPAFQFGKIYHRLRVVEVKNPLRR
jgi:hypothetical protein